MERLMRQEYDPVQFAARLARCAGMDEATGLSNLRQFLRELQREMARARRRRERVAVLVLPLDEEANIVEIAGRVTKLVRQEDLVARLGDDSLGVLLVSAAIAAGETVARRVRSEFPEADIRVGIRPVSPHENHTDGGAEVLRQAVWAAEEARACPEGFVIWSNASNSVN